ncbi:MAG: hypothetical protein ACI8RZ_006153 [Myxococcota bacterium]|jgi:hypothetical protein
MLLLLLGCSGGSPDDTAGPVGLPADFHVGVNYPWHNYGSDFGDNAWGLGGVADHESAIEADFAAMADAGVAVVRWFVLTDGRSGIRFDAEGLPAALEDSVLEDLDAVVTLAEAHGLVLVLSLLDFWWLAEAETVDGVQLGGHAGVIASAQGRTALIETVFRPLLVAFGERAGIGAWEVINEPEWAIEGLGSGWLGDGVSEAAMVALVDEAVAAIHDETSHPATVGSASITDAQRLWVAGDLDLIQVHSYDGAAQITDAAMLSVVPCVVGELGTASIYGSLSDNLSTLEERGYGGVWLWSLRGEDEASALDLDAVADWAEGR